MKVYYFTLIAIGLMFLLGLGGVETNSSQVIGAVIGTNPSGYDSTIIWVGLGAAIAAFALTGSRVTIGLYSVQLTREAITATFLGLIWGIFASDMFSVLTKIKGLSCPVGGAIASCSWTYWIAWVIIVPATIGYAISIIQFIMGTD